MCVCVYVSGITSVDRLDLLARVGLLALLARAVDLVVSVNGHETIHCCAATVLWVESLSRGLFLSRSSRASRRSFVQICLLYLSLCKLQADTLSKFVVDFVLVVRGRPPGPCHLSKALSQVCQS